MSKFTPSPQEVALVNQIFTQADAQKIGVVNGEAAVKIFSGSKLSPSVLAEIWNLADEDNKGVLTRKDVAVAIRLLGHAQRGERVTEAHIHQRKHRSSPPSVLAPPCKLFAHAVRVFQRAPRPPSRGSMHPLVGR